MAAPAFYWYPDGGSPSATLETTTLAEDLTSVDEIPIREAVDARGLSGRLGGTVAGAPLWGVRIVLERFVNAGLVRAFTALACHLERYGVVGFTADLAKAWCGYLTVAPHRGATILHTTGNVWYFTGTLTAGDELVLEGLGPEGHRETVVVQSVSGDDITLTTGVTFTWTDDIILVRARDCWPALVWPASRRSSPILTTVRRLHYTLDVLLETDPAVAAALAMHDSSTLLGSTAAFNRRTLQELLAGPILDPTASGEFKGVGGGFADFAGDVTTNGVRFL